jgi:hypothetical protein
MRYDNFPSLLRELAQTRFEIRELRIGAQRGYTVSRRLQKIPHSRRIVAHVAQNR